MDKKEGGKCKSRAMLLKLKWLVYLRFFLFDFAAARTNKKMITHSGLNMVIF